jgi:hypothetical protein
MAYNLTLGGPIGCCDRCGFEYNLSRLRKEWTGLMVCSGPGTNGCWEPRHPQEYVRGVPDRQGVRPGMRPEPEPIYLTTNQVSPDDL